MRFSNFNIKEKRGLRASTLFLIIILHFHAYSSDNTNTKNENFVTIKPTEYKHALRNPLKGFRPRIRRLFTHDYGSLYRCYMKWSDLENKKSDGIDKIKKQSDLQWKDVEKHNVKVIPRVYLEWPDKGKYWPSDMKTGDYTSNQFKKRLVRLIARLGECWDNDPRVAWVQMGLIGKWGEHHGPGITPEMEKLLGDAFTKAFKNKKVTIRNPGQFSDYKFGIYWDSWGHHSRMKTEAVQIFKLKDLWKTHPIGGEAAYDWGKYKIQPGDNPDDTLKDPKHRIPMINSIRNLHGNNLGWLAEYNQNDPEIRKAAEEVQKTFGYRFVIDEFKYPVSINANETIDVSFTLRNTGSSPFYAKWPVELSLLDAKTKKVVWKKNFKNADPSQWMPGDKWSAKTQKYEIPCEKYHVQGRFKFPVTLKQGKYIIALSVLDPAGNLPSLRFAIDNYFSGGRHPMAYVGVGTDLNSYEIPPGKFDDPAKDRTLHYKP